MILHIQFSLSFPPSFAFDPSPEVKHISIEGRRGGRKGRRAEDAPFSVDHEAEGGDTDTLTVRIGVQDFFHLGSGLDLRGGREREGGSEGRGEGGMEGNVRVDGLGTDSQEEAQ